MLRQRLHYLYSLFLSSKKTLHAASTDTGMPATAVDDTRKKSVQLLYHRSLKNSSYSTHTDKNTSGQDWLIN